MSSRHPASNKMSSKYADPQPHIPSPVPLGLVYDPWSSGRVWANGTPAYPPDFPSLAAFTSRSFSLSNLGKENCNMGFVHHNDALLSRVRKCPPLLVSPADMIKVEEGTYDQTQENFYATLYNAPPLNLNLKASNDTTSEEPLMNAKDGSRPFVCNWPHPFCSKSFSRRSDLARHQRIHTVDVNGNLVENHSSSDLP